MGKRGPKPKGTPFDSLPNAIRSDILNAIDSAASESVQDIYDRFGLSQRGVSHSWFRRFVSERRNREDFTPTPADDATPTWTELDELMRATIAEKVRAGDVKVYECGAVLRRCFEERVVRIKEEEEERARQKFAVWQEEEREKQEARAAKAENAMRKKGLDDEAIAEIRALYGIGDGDV